MSQCLHVICRDFALVKKNRVLGWSCATLNSAVRCQEELEEFVVNDVLVDDCSG